MCPDSKLIINTYQNVTDGQEWVYNKDKKTVENRSKPDRVLDIEGEDRGDGTSLCAKDRSGKDSQKWKLENW